MSKIDFNSYRAKIVSAPVLALALAFLFCLSALLTTSSAQTKPSVSRKAETLPTPVPQNPNANRIRAGPTVGPQKGAVLVPPQPQQLQLSVDRDPVQVGEIVKFTLSPADLVLKSHFLFTITTVPTFCQSLAIDC